MEHTVESLRDFESRVIISFEAGAIRGPIHLSYGNEEALIEIFKGVDSQDWVFSTWRNHYHALLHGISEEWLMEEILAGKSININNAEHNFYTSAIVGGILPIAVGVAMALKKKGSSRKVWVFVGDMASQTGIYIEAWQYSYHFDLPITFITEDNGFSTNTPTGKSWGWSSEGPLTDENYPLNKVAHFTPKELYYKYERKYPHTGIGKFVHF